jgi:hypothetical protein
MALSQLMVGQLGVDVLPTLRMGLFVDFDLQADV